LGTHLTMGQYAYGTSAKPFKTEKDYTNSWKEWIGTASGLIRQWFTWKKESKVSCTNKGWLWRWFRNLQICPNYRR
jgi:hypothetical protein